MITNSKPLLLVQQQCRRWMAQRVLTPLSSAFHSGAKALATVVPASDIIPTTPSDKKLQFQYYIDSRRDNSATRCMKRVDGGLQTALDKDGRAALFTPGSPSLLHPGSILSIETSVGTTHPRTSTFSGILVGIRQRGVMTNIILRNFILGTGVELTFPVYSPSIKRIQVLNRAPKDNATMKQINAVAAVKTTSGKGANRKGWESKGIYSRVDQLAADHARKEKRQ